MERSKVKFNIGSIMDTRTIPIRTHQLSKMYIIIQCRLHGRFNECVKIIPNKLIVSYTNTTISYRIQLTSKLSDSLIIGINCPKIENIKIVPPTLNFLLSEVNVSKTIRLDFSECREFPTDSKPIFINHMISQRYFDVVIIDGTKK